MAKAASAPDVEIVYLEPDDEIPSVIRRVHEPAAARVILVAPGRIKALSSVIALRLLARIAAADGIELSLVADPSTRGMAAEAGIAAFPSLADAQAGGPAADLPPRPLASIRVVRGETSSRGPAAAVASSESGGSAAAAISQPPAWTSRGPVTRASAGDETRPITIARPPAPVAGKRSRSQPRPARRTTSLVSWGTLNRATLLAIAGAVVVVAAVVAAVIPAATIHLTPSTRPDGPFDYRLTAPAHRDSGQLAVMVTGTVTGKHTDSTPAKGIVLFYNWSYENVLVPKGTRISAGNTVFATDADVTVPWAFFPPVERASAVTAVVPGPAGNVVPGAIDTVDDRTIDRRLRGSGANKSRVVTNPNTLTGGKSTTTQEITQKDVDGAVADLRAEAARQLDAQLAAHSDRVYVAPAKAEAPTITIPDGLVGTRGEETFELSGTLAYDRTYALAADLRNAAVQAMRADAKAIPAGRTLIERSVAVTPSSVTFADGQVVAQSRVSGQTATTIDIQALKSAIAGLPADEARTRLATLGMPRIDLWPGWVTGVPRLGFRVDIVIDAPAASATPTPSGIAPS